MSEPVTNMLPDCCPDWEVQNAKINRFIALQVVRSGNANIYDVVPYRFCPWCGAPKEKGFVGPVTQKWLNKIPMMQQTVLLTAIRGPDGITKYGPAKMLLRWYRRCILLSAMDGKVLTGPCAEGGGSFTGPSFAASAPDSIFWDEGMEPLVDDYIRALDGIPRHFQAHFMHGAEILGYKHPDEDTRSWWNQLYIRLVHDLHLHPESEAELDSRLGDSRSGWLARADKATIE